MEGICLGGGGPIGDIFVLNKSFATFLSMPPAPFFFLLVLSAPAAETGVANGPTDADVPAEEAAADAANDEMGDSDADVSLDVPPDLDVDCVCTAAAVADAAESGASGGGAGGSNCCCMIGVLASGNLPSRAGDMNPDVVIMTLVISRVIRTSFSLSVRNRDASVVEDGVPR